MKKIEYIARSLSRSTKNVYENYVLNAIYQKVNNPELEIKTQENMQTSAGSNYRIDMYLPQLQIAIEIDEPFHSGQKDADIKRENEIKLQAIIEGYGNRINIDRIKITKETTLEELNAQIDILVDKINEKIRQKGKEFEWIDDKKKIERIEQRGFIKINDSFSTNYEVLNLVLNKNFKGYQRGAYFFGNSAIWFPVISKYDKKEDCVSSHRTWINYYSKNKQYIYEKSNDPIKQKDKKIKADEDLKNKAERIIFAKERDSFGKPVTIFVGVYIADGWDSQEQAERWEQKEIRLNIPIKI